MPKEYLDCVRREQADGLSKKEAQKKCAIIYFKKHGRTPQQDEGKSSFSDIEVALFDAIETVSMAAEDS